MAKMVISLVGLLFVYLGSSSGTSDGANLAFVGAAMLGVALLAHRMDNRKRRPQSKQKKAWTSSGAGINWFTGEPMGGRTYTFNGRAFTDYGEYTKYRNEILAACEDARRNGR